MLFTIEEVTCSGAHAGAGCYVGALLGANRVFSLSLTPLARSSPVAETHDAAVRAFLLWAGQGSNLRPWDYKRRSAVSACLGALRNQPQIGGL